MDIPEKLGGRWERRGQRGPQSQALLCTSEVNGRSREAVRGLILFPGKKDLAGTSSSLGDVEGGSMCLHDNCAGVGVIFRKNHEGFLIVKVEQHGPALLTGIDLVPCLAGSGRRIRCGSERADRARRHVNPGLLLVYVERISSRWLVRWMISR